jgi:hypothetical protein
MARLSSPHVPLSAGSHASIRRQIKGFAPAPTGNAPVLPYVIKDSPIFTNSERLIIEFLFHFIQQVSLINLGFVSLDMLFQDECYAKLEAKEFTCF